MHDYTIYFKERKGFDRFIYELNNKYMSFGRITGIIKIENVSNDESKTLGRLFGTTIKPLSTFKISTSKFLKIMDNSKFVNFNVETLIEEYLEIKLTTKKELLVNKLDVEKNYFKSITDSNSGIGVQLLNKIINNNTNYKIIHQKYLKNKDKLKKDIIKIINCINHLPNRPMNLAIFATRYTTNPHFLDIDSMTSNLFILFLLQINNYEMPINREGKIKLFAKYNLEIDKISNFVITYQLRDDNRLLNSFADNNQPLILNIDNIININYVYALNKKVYIFENPSILNHIIENKLNISVIVTSGMPNLAVYLILDKLVEIGCKLYYNGDYDPEGLIIAKKLKDKYNDYLNLFLYENNDYFNCISTNVINSSRLKKLSQINNNDLLIIKDLIMKNKYAGYQENNKEKIVNYIKQNL